LDPVGSRSTRRPHPDSAADATSPGEQARRVRPRTGVEDAPPGLSPRAALPGTPAPQSPRRSMVSAEQLRQWRSSVQPSSSRQASTIPLAPRAAAAQASASSPRSPSVGAARRSAFGDLKDLRPEGRNTLIAYAAERALSDRAPAAQKNARNELTRFGDALLQQQPPISLDAFLDHLSSEDPAQRSAAEARKLAYENAQGDVLDARSRLNAGINALADVPREQRTLTLAQALQRRIVGRSLQTLLPEADQPLVQRVRNSEDKPDSDHAKTKLTALCRFGVALMVRGHGGLAAWLQMRQQQPDGERLAEELRESIKHGPELELTHGGKRGFAAATGRLLKYGLGDDGASTSRPQARTDAPTATQAAGRSAAASRASASSSHPAAMGVGPSGVRHEAQPLPPRARNTLVAFAAERALIDAGRPVNDQLTRYRSAFSRFGTALLEQHQMTLDTYLDRLSSHDPRQRDDAAAMQAAVVSEQSDSQQMRTFIGACITALNDVPRERRMLTPGEALHTRIKAAGLVTLLPDADHELLQQRLALESDPSGKSALRRQALLVRLGVALMAQGHGGLAGWVQMHHQPDGPHLAGELLDRMLNGPELRLSPYNKGELARAVAQLHECGQAHDDPPLDFADSLERSLRSPSPAAAMSPQIDATEDFAAVPVPSSADVTMEEAAGPSAAAASPTDSSWSLGSAFERLGGTEGLSALLQQMDETADASSVESVPRQGSPGAYPATTSTVTGPAVPAIDLGHLVGPNWIHHQQPVPPLLMDALDNLGWLPSPKAPQTTLQIHGRTYTAHVHDGTVWLTPSRPAHEIAGSSQLAPLPPGPVPLVALDADVGIASGQGLNCLLDTVLQLARGTRRQDHATPQAQALAQDAQELRRALAAVGLVERDGQIDVYGPGGVGVFLAQNLGLRIQVIEANEHDGLIAHPVLGQEGPLVRILHTPGHFQPLWPRRQG